MGVWVTDPCLTVGLFGLDFPVLLLGCHLEHFAERVIQSNSHKMRQRKEWELW